MLEVRGIPSRSFYMAVFLLFVGLLAITGLSDPALAQISEISPNGIVFVDEADTLTAGKAYNISAQILYNGGPLNSEGVRVYFLANNTSVIPIEMGTYALTDRYGKAIYTVTPDQSGDAKLTAMAMNANSGVSADKVYHVAKGTVTTPTVTATPTPTPAANATATPPARPTLAATPTINPTITAAPTGQPPSGNSNTQALGIITVGIVVAVIVIVVALLARAFKQK